MAERYATVFLLPLPLTFATWRVTAWDDKDNPPQLKRLFEQDDPSGVNAEHVGKLRNILATLHAATIIAHMDLPGFKLHPLKGALKGFLGRNCQGQLAGDFSF